MNDMTQQEGVIKFQLEYSPSPSLPADMLRQINAWRKITALLKLIGQDPDRYDGYGYGNISRRLEPFDAPPTQRRFVISGTQTGHLTDLTPIHYAVVSECYPARNRLVAEGPIKPSSESMTHGAIYALDPALRWVIHVHSPHLWQQAAALSLSVTNAQVPYGTPEMAAEVERLFAETDARRQGIFVMGGHEDGVVTFGHDAEEAGTVLLGFLAKAMALGQ